MSLTCRAPGPYALADKSLMVSWALLRVMHCDMSRWYGGVHLLKKDTVQAGAYLMRRVPIDINCELLHTDVADVISAACCNCHEKGYQASKVTLKHLLRASVVFGVYFA